MSAMVRVHMKRALDRLEFRGALCLCMLVCTISFVEESLAYQGWSTSALPSAAYGWIWYFEAHNITSLPILIIFFFVPMASISYADCLLIDREKGISSAVFARTDKRSYITAATICVFLVAFVTLFFPMAISQLLSFVLFPITTPEFGMRSLIYAPIDMPRHATNFILGDIFLQYPYVYNMVQLAYISCSAGIYAVFTCSLSLLVRVKRLVLHGVPALMFLVSNLVLPTSFMPARLLTTSFLSEGPSLIWWLSFPIFLLVISVGLMYFAIERLDICLQ